MQVALSITLIAQPTHAQTRGVGQIKCALAELL